MSGYRLRRPDLLPIAAAPSAAPLSSVSIDAVNRCIDSSGCKASGDPK